MKFFKYLFLLILLVFVVGSLYIATISVPGEKSINFETPLKAELFQIKIQDLSTYETWFSFPEESTSKPRLSNPENFENTTLSWQNERFEAINFQNKRFTEDSIIQQLVLKTWLSSSEMDINWTFVSSEKNSIIAVQLYSDASFMQKAEYILKGKSHIEIAENAIKESLSRLEDSIHKEISVYDISPVGKVVTGGFHLIHATSAARLNFESILDKSRPIFESVENFMQEQEFKESKGRIILFENFYEDENSLIFSSGIGTETPVAIPDYFEVLSKPISRGTYFKTQLRGDYVNLKQLLSISEATIEKRDLVINRFLKPFLEFEIDATETVSPAELVTNFYVPILE
ncbi:AraC family transcriptional regulator [Psychroflexus sp. YR1-1]|uniref:AraC family transcriptional regulator n=1 Tax=Psychroflexus aurantiacus TaxID=2709310 RepID=A0A6B3R4C8_9FLAO|nr:AraC family transcriptional regulator [Psychroflexus aurantiacus]NEV93775.1 AraC family transcriptional regulator [Psychroflexus aurantiacus]